jgi:hypothetical protein
MNGTYHVAIRRIITKFYAADGPAANIIRKIETFWNDLKDFKNKMRSYSNHSKFLSPDAIAVCSHKWPHIKLFGRLACGYTLKLLGIGSAEQNWGNVKELRSVKYSHLSGIPTDMQSIIYTTTCVTEARKRRKLTEKPNARN